MTIAEVRLAVEEVVLPYLGLYSNGDPAISTGEPASDLTAVGLECVIDKNPQMFSRPVSGYGQHVLKDWTVRFVDHGGGHSLETVVTAMLTRFTSAQVDPLVSSPQWGIAPQMAVRIPDRMRTGLPRR